MSYTDVRLVQLIDVYIDSLTVYVPVV